jgi:CheY-like chemotaxis protein/DNA-binding PadR family transcriptional regulator
MDTSTDPAGPGIAMDKPTILVVEDEAIISRDIVKTLEMFQYHPLCAVSTADEAISKAREYVPDVVLMDIHIHGTMDGIDAARIIRDELQIPIIFITSYADDATISRAKDTLPYGYVLKPFSDRDLKVAVEMALSRKAAEDQERQTGASQTDVTEKSGEQGARDDKPGLSEIRSLLMENFFQDLILLLYNNAEEKEILLASYLERAVKTTGDIFFAYAISKAHRDFLREVQDEKILLCRMKEGETSALKPTLSDFLDRTDGSFPAPRKILIDFSGPFCESDVLSVTDFLIERKNQGMAVAGIIAVLVKTNDENLVKTLSQKIPKVLVTTTRGTVISCADYTFPFEHLAFLPQPVIDEIVKKVLEPVILSLLKKPVSGYDILLEIQRRYNVSVPKARVYTYLYSLQKMGYLSTSTEGKSKRYFPTEDGEKYIREKLSEFNSVFHHIQAEIVDRDSGLTIKDQRQEGESR